MITTDFLVIGSGIAGLSYALKVADYGEVIVITKKSDSESSTNYAQGGIASVIGPNDSVHDHVEDTLKTGCGLSHRDVVEMVVGEGPEMIRQLIEWGCRFTMEKKGKLSLGREGGHSHNRIVHTDDLTGREIERALLERVKVHPNIDVRENHIAIDLLTEHHVDIMPKKGGINCYGAYVYDTAKRKVETFMSVTTMLSTGGTGQVYLHTTNPDIATGDGIAMAYRAGAKVGNLEFMQFHPTTLKRTDDGTFLISEAMRGYGGVIVDKDGNRLMEHLEMKDLSPRDIVARTIDRYLKSSGEDCVYLDVSGFDAGATIKRFPHIYETCLGYGIDITSEPIPVVPAAHYMCGGVLTDNEGKTTISNLYATGETAFTGLHGANRLASNSLLEAVVMAETASRSATNVTQKRDDLPVVNEWSAKGTFDPDEWVVISHDRNNIRQLMWDLVGIVRNDFRLSRALRHIALIRDEVEKYYRRTKVSPELIELRNMATVAWLIVLSARHRKESRGLHYNTDYPETDNAYWQHDTVIKDGEILL